MILAMIVKDEAQVIERCLDSALETGLVEAWVIIDTGSTDGTQDLIREKLKGIPGHLIDRPWVSFGHNRNELLDKVNEHYMLGQVLLLDADMTIEGTWEAPDIEHRQAGYLVKSIEGQMEHYVCRIIEVGSKWRYVGATHEVITKHGFIPTQKASLVITHHADGGNRADKFERDRQLLLQDYHRDPTNTRTVFYLANTFRDLGRTDSAVDWYLERAKMGGWEEEVYYSLWQAGRLDNDFALLVKAWEHSPHRGEALHDAMSMLNATGCHRTVIALYEGGWRGEYGREDSILFTEPWRERWGIPTEYAVALWHTGAIDRAQVFFEYLNQRTDLTPEQRTVTEANLECCRPSPVGR
jgi:glycosyltransferase involved in cell wall biosynthesis